MPRLYKYISDPAVAQYLLRGQIKFTPIHELNDPSELTPDVIAENVEESLCRLRKEGYAERDLMHLRRQEAVLQKLAPGFQAVGAPKSVEEANRIIRSSFYDRIEALEYLLAETAKAISEKVGVFCLSKRFDSLPMWAHYADNAAGFVVEFRHLHETFPGDETGVLWEPTEVRYERGADGVTFEPRSHDAIFFEKFSDWSYEEEVRVLAPLDDCICLSTEDDREMHVVKIPTSSIARLILGWNMSLAGSDEVRRAARASGGTVSVVQAGLENGYVKV